jgi:hypothetical protein
LSSLRGPSATEGAANQSGKFLTYFLEQLGDGGGFYGVCGAGSVDDDEPRRVGPTAVAEAPLEQRVARAAVGGGAEDGGGRRDAQRLHRARLGDLR